MTRSRYPLDTVEQTIRYASEGDVQKMDSPRSFELRTARNIDDLESCRSFWEKANYHPNADIDFYKVIVSARPEITSPDVTFLFADGQPDSMLVARVEEVRPPLRIGYKTLHTPKVRILSVIQGGTIGSISEEKARIFVDTLCSRMKHERIDAILFHYLPTNSPFFKVLSTRPGFFSRDLLVRRNTHWAMPMPESVEIFLQRLSPKHRYWMRRLPRVLEKDFPGHVALRLFTDRSDIATLSKDVDRIARKTYQRGLGVGYLDNAENQRRIALAAGKGWLRAYVLYVHNAPSAFWLGTLYKGIFHLDFTGYDPAFRKYEPGTILFLKMLEDLCTKNVRSIDFGLGDAGYKQRFGEQCWMEASVFVFGATLAGMRLKLVHTATNLVSLGLTKAMSSDQFKRFRKAWRKQLSP